MAIEVGQRLSGDDVARVLEQVSIGRENRRSVRTDDAPAIISRGVNLNVHFNAAQLDFGRPGKPADTMVIEAFNGRLRDACLNQHWYRHWTKQSG